MHESMVHKEFELTREEAKKLARVAAERGCSEDEVVRAAIERLEHTPDDDDQRELEDNRRWLAAQPHAGLNQTIVDDHEYGYHGPPEPRSIPELDDWPDLPEGLRVLAEAGAIRLPRKPTPDDERELARAMAILDSYTAPLNLSALLDEERDAEF